MLKRSLLGTAFGIALLPIVATATSANIASMTQTAIGTSETMVIQIAQRKGGGGAHKANKGANKSVKKKSNVSVNKNVNRNVNVKKNVNVNRNVTVNRGLYSGRHVYTGGAWVRPGAYWWPVGGAVAAGAAIGFASAAVASAWAGQPPGPNYCWFYTDEGRQQGFWDNCP
jgi:hypothetical protein